MQQQIYLVEQMDVSSVITYSYGCVIYCCCYIRQTTMAFATDHQIVLWDFASNKTVTSFNLNSQASPVLIKMVANMNGTATILLQDKMGVISVLKYDQLQRRISLTNQYSIQILGFTKIALDKSIFNTQCNVQTAFDDYFYTLHYPNTIQNKKITDGHLTHSFNVECEFADATFLLRFEIEQIEYLLIAEQGAIIKQFQLHKSIDNEGVSDLKGKLVIPSKEQIKIVLTIEPINNYQAIICLRNDQMTIINLKTLSIERRLNYNQFRLIKRMTDNQQVYAVTGKNQIGFLIGSTIKACEKLHTKLIMDMDICPYGSIGVTQQGKIWFLSLS